MLLFFKLIRLSQWQKNFLIFLPLIMANEYEVFNINKSIVGFLIFSIAASAVYIFNDLVDLPKDKIHPSKKRRPLASGAISVKKALIILLFFLTTTIYFGFINKVLSILLLYFLLNIFYSLIIKKVRYLDIILLSSFYIIRIYFGGKIYDVEISLWLYIFCYLAFISLVILKRVNEIKKYNLTKILYSSNDLGTLKIILNSSNSFSVLFIMSYFLSEKVSKIYATPSLLWMILPLYIFWMLNINKAALSGKMNDDPVNFVVSNSKSYITILLMGIVILCAQFVRL